MSCTVNQHLSCLATKSTQHLFKSAAESGDSHTRANSRTVAGRCECTCRQWGRSGVKRSSRDVTSLLKFRNRLIFCNKCRNQTIESLSEVSFFKQNNPFWLLGESTKKILSTAIKSVSLQKLQNLNPFNCGWILNLTTLLNNTLVKSQTKTRIPFKVCGVRQPLLQGKSDHLMGNKTLKGWVYGQETYN